MIVYTLIKTINYISSNIHTVEKRNRFICVMSAAINCKMSFLNILLIDGQNLSALIHSFLLFFTAIPFIGTLRTQDKESVDVMCKKEREITEKLSSSTLPDVSIPNVVKSAQSLGKGIKECIAIYKNVKQLKERIHNRSLPDIINTENEDKINKVCIFLYKMLYVNDDAF